MKTAPIHPAALSFTDEGVPWSEHFGDVYHPRAGAFAQAHHVFLAGNGLPARWAQAPQQRFVILETGFGLGNNFLATWETWRQAPEPKPALDFISIERHPFALADMQRAHSLSPCPSLTAELLGQWPPLTHNLHTLCFDKGRVRLLLALGDALEWLPELVTSVDAFYLDGFAPAKNPEIWQERVFKGIGRLAARGATAATWSAARAVRDGLTTAGFEVQTAPGFGGKRDITLARFAPRFNLRPAPRQAAVMRGSPPHALIIGGGLAGCGTARGLARVGWQSTILDASAQPAGGASGNPGGLFHGIVNGQDGSHSRLYRAAALSISIAVRHAIQAYGVAGQVEGLVRLEVRRSEAEMQALLAQQGLPGEFVRAVGAHEASALCGVLLPSPGWFFAAGGWVDPRGLCLAYLAEAGDHTQFHGGASVSSIHHREGLWVAENAAGQELGSAPALVVANAGDAVRLLDWPEGRMHAVRGQISWCDKAAPAQALGWPAHGPLKPMAGAGYWLPPAAERRVFGATSQPHDMAPELRDADHAANIQQLSRLQGRTLDGAAALELVRRVQPQGRVGWRWNTEDKLPIWGAVPKPHGAPQEQVRQVDRVPGLFVCTGLGSRGITWSALAGEVMAALISGSPCPIESSLLDAVDPARFQARETRAAQAEEFKD